MRPAQLGRKAVRLGRRLRHVLALCAGILCSAACVEGDANAHLYFSDLPLPDLITPEIDPPAHGLRAVGAWGEIDGPLAFARIKAVAVRNNRLIVADGGTCTLVAIDLQSNATERLGQCGQGPEEFSDISALSFVSDDEVLVADFGTNRLTIIDLRTQEFRPLRISDWPPHFIAVSSLAPLEGGDVVIGMRIQPAVRGAESHDLVTFESEKSPIATSTAVADAQIGQTTERPYLRGAFVCALGDDYWAVTNVWAAQTVVVKGRAVSDPMANFGTRLPWFQPVDRAEGLGAWRPPLPHPGLGCGDGRVVLTYLRRNSVTASSQERFATDGYVEVRSYEGDVLYAKQARLPPNGDPTTMTAGAILGDTIFLFTNEFAVAPVVRAFELLPDDGR